MNTRFEVSIPFAVLLKPSVPQWRKGDEHFVISIRRAWWAGEPILVREFYRDENRKFRCPRRLSSFCMWMFSKSMPSWASFAAAWRGGRRLLFPSNTPATIVQALRRQCLRHLYQRLGVQFSCAQIECVACESHGVTRSRDWRKRKPRSRTRPTVDGREPGSGWWWQLIQNVPEMSHREKTA